MNEMQIFTHNQFGEIRVVEKDGQPWFVAAHRRLLHPKDGRRSGS